MKNEKRKVLPSAEAGLFDLQIPMHFVFEAWVSLNFYLTINFLKEELLWIV
jgi:hypothetical protein